MTGNSCVMGTVERLVEFERQILRCRCKCVCNSRIELGNLRKEEQENYPCTVEEEMTLEFT